MQPTVMNEQTIIGHLPRKISKVCSVFLQKGGSIRWMEYAQYSTMTGSRRYSLQKVLLSKNIRERVDV